MPERRIPFAHGISFVRKGPAEILQDLFPVEGEECSVPTPSPASDRVAENVRIRGPARAAFLTRCRGVRRGGECPDQGPCAASVLASVFCELSTARSAHGTRVAPDRTAPPGPVAGGEGTITKQRLLYDFFIFYPLTLLWGGDRLCSMIVSTQPNRVLTTSRTEAAGGRRRWNCRNVK